MCLKSELLEMFEVLRKPHDRGESVPHAYVLVSLARTLEYTISLAVSIVVVW